MTWKGSSRVSKPFFIAGPTAAGKSELAADVAAAVNAEIISGDAFQIYKELRILTAQPEADVLARVPHHLVGELGVSEETNAERFRTLATERMRDIFARGKRVLVVGGSGLYLKALTHGLSRLPETDSDLRRELSEMSPDEQVARLRDLDPATAEKTDLKNPRRVMRALEIRLLTGRPASGQRTTWARADDSEGETPFGCLLERDRDQLKDRINRRVEKMFEDGAIEEVRQLPEQIGRTAGQTIGLKQIQRHLAGEISRDECIREIQAATRQYAKRQLTWFRHQSNFVSLNLSSICHAEAVDRLVERVFSLS